MSVEHPFLEHTKPLPIAHRGGAIDQPENTMPAFQHAVDLGYTHVETDVHVTVDGVLVAFHDPTLDRVTDRTGRIDELTWDEVSAARVTGLDGSTAAIPRFDELMTTFPQLSVSVDPKEDSSVAPLQRALRELDCLDRVCVGSFSDKRQTAFRETFGRDVCLGLGPREAARLRFASWGAPLGSLTGDIAQVPMRQGRIPVVDRRFVDRAHRAGLLVHVWTIDDEADMHALFDLGVDAIMTDRPSALLGVMADRGEWPHGG